MPTEGLTGGKKGLRVKSYEIVPDHLLLGLASHTYPLACIVVLQIHRYVRMTRTLEIGLE